MIPLQITVQVKGLDKIAAKFKGPMKTNILRAATKEFWQITRENFGANKPNRPAPWPPLSPAYAKRVKPPIPTLLRTGRLLNSIRWGVESTQYGRVWSDNPYSGVHQWGSTKQNIPARQYLPIEYRGVTGGGYNLTPYAFNRINAAIGKALTDL